MMTTAFEATAIMPIKRFATALSYGMALGMSLMVTSGFADDTEVFYAQIVDNTSEASNSPNVLFVLDDSPSMLDHDEGQEGSRLLRMRQAMKQILTQVEDNLNVGVMTLSGLEGGGMVRYPVTPIGQSVCDDGSCNAVNLFMGIDKDSNDVVQSVSTGTVTLDGEELTIGRANGGTGEEQIVGLRFEELGIPQGAVITSAYFRLSVATPYEGNGAITVRGEATDSAEVFTTSNANLSERESTDASVRYLQGDWREGESYASRNVKSIIQEIVDRPGWCGGNDMAFLLNASDSRSMLSSEGVSSRGDGNTATLRLTYDATGLAEGEGCMLQTEVLPGQQFGLNDAQQFF